MATIPEQIRELIQLLEQGYITAEQFEEGKQAILSGSGGGATSDASRGGSDPGELVGQYRILDRLGAGGMGAVYRARHRIEAMADRQGGDVALKVMHADLAADDSYRARFEREASIGLKLQHPAIVRVLDAQVTGDSQLLVAMELVEGRTLTRVLSEETGPIPAGRAMAMFRPVFWAVSYAHSKGVVHRDLKPDNVMVRPDGSLTILDFGIAKDEGSRIRTRTGAVIGTPDYMAPEQHEDASRADARADVYGLGMTLYHALAGRLPWSENADVVEVMFRKKQGDLQPPSSHYPDVPGGVERAVMRALAPAQQDRFESVDAFLEALEQGLGPPRGTPPRPEPPPPPLEDESDEAPSEDAGPTGGDEDPDGSTGADAEGARVEPAGTARPHRIGCPAVALVLMLLTFAVVVAVLMERNQRVRDDQLACARARDAGASSGWRAYLDNHPEGLCADEAHREIREFEDALAVREADARACQAAAGEGTATAWQRYLDMWPQGDCAERAVTELERGMVQVAGGTFWMGCKPSVDDGCDDDEKPGREVYVDSFLIDRTEVTVGAYGACVEARGCSYDGYVHGDTRYDEGWRDRFNYGAEGRDEHPINGVTWVHAEAYCSWRGARLPTEAEWAKAARGPYGRKLPWGNGVATCSRTVMYDDGYGCGSDTTLPVGSRPEGASPYHVLDMAGNLAEWTADRYSASYFSEPPTRNPTGPIGGDERVVRGSHFSTSSSALRAGARQGVDENAAAPWLGFRCARDPR